MHNYLELKIWQRSRALAKAIYQLTESFPGDQQYGLTSQIQRAAISIPSNIAEGAGRNSSKEFMRFLDIANGSAFELETQLFLSSDLGYANVDQVENIILELKEIQKMIFKFRSSLES